MHLTHTHTQVPGNVNEETGGPAVRIWYRKSAGAVAYDPTRPQAGGYSDPVLDLWVRADSDPAAPAPATDPVGSGPTLGWISGDRYDPPARLGLTRHPS